MAATGPSGRAERRLIYLVRAAAKAVRADGFIHVVDFGDLRSLWPVASRTLRAWLRLFHVAPRDELLILLEAGSRRRG